MTIFDDTDLNGFSDLCTDVAFRDVCDIQRATRTEKASGAATVTWSTIATNVPCMVVAPKKVFEEFVAQQFDERVIKTVLFARGTDIRKTDHLVIAGTTYRVYATPDPVSYEVVRKVYIEQPPGDGSQ